MLQDNMLYVMLLGVVAVIALTANYILTTKEEQNKRKQERLKYLSAQAEHIIQAVSVLREANCKPDIVEKIDEHLMSLIDEVGMLAPDSPLYADLNQQKSAADNAIATSDIFSSDKSLKRAQIYINFAEKLSLQMARGGKITTSLARNYQQELYWLKVNVVVSAHISQGVRFRDQKDTLTAHTHFKHAKALLIGATLPQHNKKERLAELQVMIDEVEPRRVEQKHTQLDDDYDKFW